MDDLTKLLQEVADNEYDTAIARSIVLECKEENIEEVMEVLFQHEGEYFFRYVVPWLPGNVVVKKLIELLGRMNPDFHPHIYWIVRHLLNSEISGFEDEFMKQIKTIFNFDDRDLSQLVIESCNRYISEDLANYLLEHMGKDDDHFVDPIIHNSSIKNIKSNLEKIVASGCGLGFPNQVFETLLIRFYNEELTEVFQYLKDNDMLGRSPWKVDYSGSVFSKIMLYGCNHHLSLIDLFPKEIQERESVMISNLKSVLNSRTNSIISSESVPVNVFDKWIEHVIKGRRGFSETKFRGFYAGLSEGAQPSHKRQFILSEILQKVLQKVHFSRVPEHFPVGTNRWHVARTSMGFLLGGWNHSDFRKRIASAKEYAIKKPYAPWGFYGFEILNQDRWELMRKHGLSVGLIPYLESSSLGLSFVSCKILDLNSRSDENEPRCCEDTSISVSELSMNCKSCGTELADFQLSWGDAKKQVTSNVLKEQLESVPIVVGKLEINSDDEVIFSQNGKEITKVTKRKYLNSREEMKQFWSYMPIPVRDHLAAMHADVEEMSGIGGDAMKRWGLD